MSHLGVSNEPRRNSARLAFVVVLFLAIVLYNAYAAFLTSFLSIREVNLPFYNLEEMYKRTNFKVFRSIVQSLHDFFSRDNQIYCSMEQLLGQELSIILKALRTRKW